jgi:hypothetical protein
MTRRTSLDTKPHQVRLAEGQWEKCQQHAEAMSEQYPGMRVTPTAVLRMALDRGLAELARDRQEEP